MTLSQLLVDAGGLVLIGFLWWFFFGERGAASARVSESRIPNPEARTLSAETADLAIGGMTCAACVNRIEKAMRKVPGVFDAQVNLLSNSGTATYDPSQTNPGD